MPRLACAAALLALAIAGCGGNSDTTTVTETAQAGNQVTTTTSQGGTVTVQRSAPVPTGNQGPHHFETPSHNIGCYLDSKSVRCDIREHDWTAPPKPKYCIKAGVDWGGGVAVASHRASIVCAGDTTLGGPGLLGYGHSARRGPIYCISRTAGITCRNADTKHGFFLSRASYRLF
jgi:Family of unknown function (DUF6636)